MKTRTLTRLLVLLLVAILGLSGLVISGTGVITAQAATDTTYSIAIAGAAWGHSTNLTFMNGMVHHANNFWNFFFVNAYDHAICYCIEPGTAIPDWGIEDSTYTEKDEVWFDTKVDNDAFNSTIDGRTVRSHLGRIMQYGYVGAVPWEWRSDPTGAYRAPIAKAIATQIMVWEVIVGERDAAFNHVTVPSGRNRVLEVISSSNPLRTEIMTAYTAIENGVKAHTNKPSFMAETLSGAQTVTLKWDGSKYSATLTDTNNVLSNYNFTASNGVTCSVSGNSLTLSADTAPSGAVTVTATKQASRKGVVVWFKEAYQTMVSYSQEVDDPILGYVKVKAEQKGKAKIVKAATNGGTVADWEFEIYTDAACTQGIGYYVTNADGVITADLTPGTYYVKELESQYYQDEQWVDEYWVMDARVQKITVKAGETVTVTFTNQYVGRMTIRKRCSNGGTLGGWEFTIYSDRGCTVPVGTYTTSSYGWAGDVKLKQGTYYVKETGAPDGVNLDYWAIDDSVQEVTVKAGEDATVTFANRYIGRAKIIKALANPEAGSLEGWNFTVSNASGTVGTYTTNASGEILLDLEPGTYTVTENIPDGSLWECPGGVTKTVTVKVGETVAVTFTNSLRPGEIHICKEDTEGEPLDGVEFRLEWSEDGISWSPVTYADSAVPQIGGCTTEGLTDGKLVSDGNGLVTFSGLYPTLQYRLTETATKNGYQLLTEPAYEGTLPVDDDLKVSIKVINAEIFTLPQTGAKSMVLLPLGIFLSLAACIGAIVSIQRKEA